MDLLFRIGVFQLAFGIAWADSMPPCDQGWIVARGNCYLINNQKKITWSEARDECNNYRASSLYFETMDELTWYKTNVTVQYPSSGYWTSMNDVKGNHLSEPGTGAWKWNMYEYINTDIVKWSSSPANDGRPACGGVNLQGRMYDADCNSMQGYICQIDGGVANGGCPIGWIITKLDCFYVSNTSTPGSLMTWSQAKAWCVSLNSKAHLFVIDDINDQTFLAGNLPYMAQTTYLFWTGLQGSGQAGGWSWINGAILNQNLFSWAVEPDGVAGQENCGVIRYNGKFSDRGCGMKQNYICVRTQRNAGPVSNNLGCGLMTRAGSKCYGFYTSSKSTWQDAKQACGSINGDLVNVQDLDVKEWITQQMLNPSLDHYYWTALNDRQTEGTYQWGDGSVYDPKIIAWDHETNNYGGDEDCDIVCPATGTYKIQRYAVYTYKCAPICEANSLKSGETPNVSASHQASGNLKKAWDHEPNNYGGDEDCGMVWPATGTYNDMPCTYKCAPLCEVNNVQTCPSSGTWISRPADTGSGSDCYLFGQYANTSLWMTADESGDYCSSLAVHTTDQYGTPVSVVPHLLIVNSAGERDWIAQQLISRKDNAVGFWTSLNDRSSEGFWQFGNDPTIDTSFVNWGGEPHVGTQFNCGAVGYGANFYIRDCNKQYAYICERSAFLSWNNSAISLKGYPAALAVLFQLLFRCWINSLNTHYSS